MIKEAVLRVQSQKQVKKLKKLTSHLFTYIFLIAVSFLILQPLIDKFTVVFQGYDDLMDSSVKFIPKTFTLFNVTMAIEGMNYWSALRNTVLLCLFTAILQTFFSAFIAYGFARFRFPGRRILFFAILVVLIIPPQLLMSPYYAYFRYFDIFGIVRAVTGRPLNLLDTPAPFCILSICGIGFKNSLYIYMMRQYYTNLPSQLEEAAAIDGAGALGTYFRIILPNARTMMVTVFCFPFHGNGRIIFSATCSFRPPTFCPAHWLTFPFSVPSTFPLSFAAQSSIPGSC